MYAKVFRQMYDGTLATNGPWEALVTFQQLLVLANDQGEVDMTAAAIARVTTIPLNIIERGLGVLMAPDPESRTPDEDGRRLVALSEGRSWGWRIVNYLKYRAIQKEEERREYHRRYYHEKRKKTVETQQHQQISTVSTDSTDTEADTEAEERNTVPTVLVPSASPRAPETPFQSILDQYHRLLPMLPRVAVLNEGRKRAIASRWREVINDPDIAKAQDPRAAALDWFAWFFEHAAGSRFLTGKAKDWRADFDFLMTQSKFAKVVEGSYHRESV